MRVGTRQSPSMLMSAPIRHSNRHTLPVSTLLRFKSSAALAEVDDTEELFTGHTEGHAAAAEARNKLDTSHEEAWMINLGRGSNNQWLTGPRDEEWFTGLPPAQCPGKSQMRKQYPTTLCFRHDEYCRHDGNQ
jgi:hypothetical protein